MSPESAPFARRFAIIVLASFALVVTPVVAQLVTNPTFDADVSGWSASYQQALVEWSALDAGANPDSGSALVTNVAGGPGDGSGAYQCVGGIPAQATYWLTAVVQFPSGQTETGFADLLVQLFAEPGCKGSATGLVLSSAVNSSRQDQWLPLWKLFTTPALTQSLRLRLDLYKVEAGGSLGAHFDDVELFLAVFVDGFEVGDTSAWSMTEPPI